MLTANKVWINGVELDLRTRALHRNGQAVPLRAKTFDLLLYLIEHRDRLVTKDELISELWRGAPVTMDALVQTVLDLRRVLGDEAQNPRFIKTVSKVGYQLIATVEDTDPILLLQEEPPPSPSPAAFTPPSKRPWIVAGAGAVLLLIVIVVLMLRSGLLRPAQSELEQWEIAWWKLNEGSGVKITDSVHGLSAVLPPGISWTRGISGGGLLFRGRELRVRGTDPGVLPVGITPGTVCAWIKTDTTNADTTTIFMAGDPRPDSFAGFGIGLHESGTASFGYGHYPLFGKRRIDDNRWHQISGLFEGPDTPHMRLFVDGVEEASRIVDVATLKAARKRGWSIGSGLAGGTGFRGTLDDVRLYERALRADELHTMFRCLSGADDIQLDDRGSYQYVPIFGDKVETLTREPGESSVPMRNAGNDFAGVAFARPDADCGLRSIHGADIGQDLNIEVKLRVPLGANGAITDGGPFFRSRRANPGDGIVGGTSAGFWVQLDSIGQVRVRRLHPNAILGFSQSVKDFDSSAFHRLEVAFHGETLQVALDGRLLTFDAAGVQTASLNLRPDWENASPKGINGGCGGIAFGCSRNRGQAGGQEARDIRVKPYRALTPPGA